LVWITFLAVMDEDGFVALSAAGNVALRARVSHEDAEVAIRTLEAPDRVDPAQEHDGRRIERVPYGWLVLNSAKYRDIIKRENAREQTRARVAKFRAKSKRKKCNAPVTVDNEKVTLSDTVSVSNKNLDATRLSDSPSGSQPKERTVPLGEQKTPIAATGTTRAREAKTVPETREAWTAYSTAYQARYGVEPVRNAKVSGQFANLLKRLGSGEAPSVAAFYVSHNSAIYVRSKHAVDLLLRDCEGIRTEWASGRMVTDTRARQLDRKQNNLGVAEQLIAEIRAKESINDK
jgi:hypothetical protein